MSDKRLDDIIRSKLMDFESNDQPQGWSRLKDKMHASDTDFDNLIKTKLNPHTATMTDESWSQLYSRYQRQKYLRNQVIVIKSGELLILLLCFFTFFNFTNLFEKGALDQQLASVITEEPLQLIGEDDFDYTSIPSPSPMHGTNDSEDKNLINTKPNASARIASTQNFKHQEKLNQRISEQNDLISSSTIDYHPDRQDVHQNDYVTNAEELPVNNAVQTEYDDVRLSQDSDSNSVSALVANNTPLFPASDKLSRSSIAEMDRLHKDFLALLAWEKQVPVLNQTYNPARKQWKKSWFVFSSINNYTILSPRDEIYDIEEKVLYTPGFSINAMYGLSKNGLDVMAGLSYSRISYKPYPIQETYQSEEGINIISLKRIQYDIISVPVMLRKHLIRTSDWSLFVGMGVQAGLVIHEHYGIEDKLDVPIPRPESVRGDARYRSMLSEKEFTRAVFNGGKFSDNVFLHGSVHGGVERRVGVRTNLFLSAEYAYHLMSPLGPNNDQINIFSFGVGLRFDLN